MTLYNAIYEVLAKPIRFEGRQIVLDFIKTLKLVSVVMTTNNELVIKSMLNNENKLYTIEKIPNIVFNPCLKALISNNYIITKHDDKLEIHLLTYDENNEEVVMGINFSEVNEIDYVWFLHNRSLIEYQIPKINVIQ